MKFSCESQIPQTAYRLENERKIEEIFRLTGIKIEQSEKYGWTMGILTDGDVYGVVFGDNPLELLKLGIALAETTEYEIEVGSDEEFEKEGAGSLLFSKETFNGHEIKK